MHKHQRNEFEIQESILHFVDGKQKGGLGECAIVPVFEVAAIFAIAMPIADPGNRAISETRQSNAALRFKGAIESR